MELSTPIYARVEKDLMKRIDKPEAPVQWPDHKVFYLIASDGWFICRNHDWFQSCVKTEKGPGELEPQETFSTFSYPKVPRHLMERAIAFFRHITNTKHWESALLLVFNKDTQQVELFCPPQEASGGTVKYTTPVLPNHLVVMGDAHSHCNFGAFASGMDTADEECRPGVHIIVGDQWKKVPSFHCDCVLDGERFTMDMDEVVEDFDILESAPEAVDFPMEWVALVKEHKWEWTGGGSWKGKGPDKKDKKIVDRILRGYKRNATPENRPTVSEVRQRLFESTKLASHTWCEDKATAFINEVWGDVNETTGTQQNATTTFAE